MGHRIFPICTGEIVVDQGIHVTYRCGIGHKVNIPATAWLVRGPEGDLLIDTGMCDTERADKWHHPGSYQRPGQDILSRLRAMGVSPAQVKHVIFTHLHWDHCSNMALFNKAVFVASQEEIQFALNPIPPYWRSYEHPRLGLNPPFSNMKFQPVNHASEIVPGITIIPTPGHSPGHCSVLINGRDKTYVVAGDAVFSYENLAEDKKNGLPLTPIGRFVDMVEMWNSLLLLARMGAHILPGHDFHVFEKECYE